MKKIFYLVASICLTSLIISCCDCHSEQKYCISDSFGRTYYTKSYTLRNGCVVFLDEEKKDSTLVCGSYRIENNPDYKPEYKKH